MDGLIITGLHEALVIPVAFDWPSPDRIVEAIGTGAAKRAQRANRAGQDQITDRFKLEKDTQAKVLARLAKLKDALAKRLLADGDGTITDFRRFNLSQLSAEVDRLTLDAQADLGKTAERDYTAADQLGVNAAQEPMDAAQLSITKQLPGLDRPLVQAAFGNTVDLLTPPMQQYATQVKVALRGVALAGDNKFAAIAKLRDQIGGPNFQKAQYQAERIIRTELGRTFNTATYERLVALSKDFPFLRKGWRATKDSRVRIGHKEAGVNYARGLGIKVDARFSVAVYDERPGKSPKLMGVATLLYPVDPGAKPEGRIAAGATIMCRCNGFVDFNLDEFASYTKSKVATALGDVQKPEPPTGPKAIPGDDVSLAKSLKKSVNYYKGTYYGSQADMEALAGRLGRTGIRVVKGPAGRGFYYIEDEAGFRFGPDGWRTGKVPKVRVPKVKVPTAADVTPEPVKAVGPLGTPISGKLQVPASPLWNWARQAMKLLDTVMGDGPLMPIPLNGGGGRSYGKFTYYRNGGAKDIKISATGQTAHPYNTLYHETGHWLDTYGIGKTGGTSYNVFERTGTYSSQGLPEMEAWRAAAKNSEAYDTMRKWRTGTGGDGVIPSGVNAKHLRYLMSTEETWARSYAQYVAVKAGGPALDELRRMQAQATTGAVAKDRPYNYGPMGTQAGAAAADRAWDYPTVWSDADFKPIEQAIDSLFQKLGWRKHGG